MIEESTKYLPEFHHSFVVQADFDDLARWRKLAMRIPVFRDYLLKRAISRGDIYIRPYKVDPAKPKKYREGIWLVRNTTQREDGVYGTVGYSKFRNLFWSLKHR